MHKIKGHKKNQRIGKAGVAVAVALIFSSTFSGEIQSFIESGLRAKGHKTVAVERTGKADTASDSVSPEPVQIVEPAIVTEDQVSSPQDELISSAAPAEPKEADVPSGVNAEPELTAAPKPVVAAKPVKKVATKPIKAPQSKVANLSPPQIVYQTELPPVPTFNAPAQIAEKPLKFSAPAKAVREMPRQEPKSEVAPVAASAKEEVVPAGVYSLNTAPTAATVPEKALVKQMPTVKTQAGDKAVLAMPDGSTRVVAVGENVPGFGVVNKLTKNEVIFGAEK